MFLRRLGVTDDPVDVVDRFGRCITAAESRQYPQVGVLVKKRLRMPQVGRRFDRSCEIIPVVYAESKTVSRRRILHLLRVFVIVKNRDDMGLLHDLPCAYMV